MTIRDEIYEAITIQALYMRKEIYFGSGMDKDLFDSTYLDNLGEYERELAKREGIELD